jgi:flagellum-specific peptidoglycan hydrolase FlgJ
MTEALKRGTAELLDLYKAEAKSGWDKFHSTELPPSLLGGSATQTEYGNAIKLTDPKTGKDRTVSLISSGERRTVTNVGFRGKGDATEVFYIYEDPDDPNGYGEAVVPFDSLEGMSLINDTGSIGAIAKMVGMSVEDVENIDTVANSGDASTVNEGGDEEGGEEGGEEGEEDVVQQDGSAPDTIGDYKTALDEMATLTGLGLGFMQPREQKLAAEIQNEPLKVQAARVNEEIATLENEIKNTPSYKRGQSSFKNKKKSLEKLKALKEKQQGIDTPEAKSSRIDSIESRITDIDIELLDLQGRGTQKAKDRRKLEAEKMNLRGEMAEIDPEYYADTQIPSERPEVATDTGLAIQGEGAGIAYSKPQPPQDLNSFEVGGEADGSTKEQREDAFKEAVRMAEEAGHPYPEAVATQYALESGYGKKKAANYNYFGLKSSPAMIKRLADAGIEATAGDSVATQEVIDGKTKTIKDSFLSFKSPEDAFTAYLMFIDTTKKDGERRYGEALDESETALDYLKGIRKAGYATATNYADSLNTVAKGFGIDLAEIERKPVGTASN